MIVITKLSLINGQIKSIYDSYNILLFDIYTFYLPIKVWIFNRNIIYNTNI